MFVRVLGSAAGGGFPQWNCNCPNCQRARAGDPLVRPRTQASLAVSADGISWVLLNASPDLPAQLRAAPCLWPAAKNGARHSPITAVVISGGDIDCIAGLLSLREGHEFSVYAPESVLEILHENQVFSVLNRENVRFETLGVDGSTSIAGLTIASFPVPGKIPLYQEAGRDLAALVSADAVIGLSVTDRQDQTLLFIPGCAAVTDDIACRAAGAKIMFFDGTVWDDNEMITSGTGTKTGTRMGHMSVSRTLTAFAPVTEPRKILIHINNTNPILCDDSREAKSVQTAGWEIAYDGMEITL
jgi:pyrroloquinoline quinone biosynthesis protein B